MRHKSSFDETRNHDFIAEHSNRMLAWDFIRAALKGETYNTKDISERTGTPIRNLYDIIDGVKDKLKRKLRNES